MLASASTRTCLVLPLALAFAIGLTGTARADHIVGTAGDDRIRGTGQADLIEALTGNDRVAARGGADTVVGADGLDRIWGGHGADRLYGGAGPDRLWGGYGPDQSWGDDGDDVMGGGYGDDRQWGGAGNDTIYANRGRDESWGEAGDDTLWALARKDVHGPNDSQGDTLHGGPGNDTFRTRDGELDIVDCGEGVDTALLDFKDVITDATPVNPNGSCEVVNRARHRNGQDRRETADAKEPTTSLD